MLGFLVSPSYMFNNTRKLDQSKQIEDQNSHRFRLLDNLKTEKLHMQIEFPHWGKA